VQELDFDVLIVGSGLAGLSAALRLAPTHRVAVITKRAITDGSSQCAQGGIAAVLGERDSFEAHVQDTFVAGAGLCAPDATRLVVEQAPECIAWLRELGVPFSMEEGQLHLTREGGTASGASCTPPMPRAQRCSARSSPRCAPRPRSRCSSSTRWWT